MRGIFKFTALVGLLAGMLAGPAHGQTLICFKSTSGTGCTPVATGAPLPVTSSGTSPVIVQVSPYNYTPLSPMQSGLAIASSTALTIPTGATYAVACARGQNVNYKTDGGTPTAASNGGMALLQNQCMAIEGATTLSNFRAIQQAATATLDVSYFK